MNSSSRDSSKLVRAISLALSLAFFSAGVTALAHEDHEKEETGGHQFVPKPQKAPTVPAARYSGATPIDETNGIAMNSGTYGNRNPDYESWASGSTWAVSLSEREYNYDQKDRFISTLDERIRNFELAVWNYSRVTDTVSKPEGKAHAEKAAADLNPRIEKARDAWSKAKSSNRGDWESAQANAKRAFIELQSFYYGMHKSVR